MTRTLSILGCLALAACEPEHLAPPDELFEDELARVSCDPLMSVFPVDAAHNIGYDAASCGTGTCVTSCPDRNANSDWGGAHHGIDIFAYQRAPLVAVADGQVVEVGTPSSTSGLRVRLKDACGWEYYYGHMDQAVVSKYQWVSAGQLLGYMGRTGTASTHTHFNVSPEGAYSSDINPFNLLNSTSGTACDIAPPPPPPPPSVAIPPRPTGCGLIPDGMGLPVNTSIASCDGRFNLSMQGDGNLVLYAGVWPLWNSGTQGHPGSVLWMQTDGNMVVYDPSGWPLWSSGTAYAGTDAVIQNDGNFVLYSNGWPVWSSGTCCY